MNDVPIAGYKDENNEYHKGIENYISNSQYTEGEQGKKHRKEVVKNISTNWIALSQNSKFHAIFATSSIPEAVKYYRLFKKICPESRVAALFEPTIDNNGSHAHEKEDGIIEMLEDYNERYGQDFSILHTLSIRKMLLIVLHIYGSHSHAHRKYSRYCGLFRQGHGLFY